MLCDVFMFGLSVDNNYYVDDYGVGDVGEGCYCCEVEEDMGWVLW